MPADSPTSTMDPPPQAAAAPPSPRPSDSITGLGVRRALFDIKLAHTIFAMPFAILGAFLAHVATPKDDWRRFAGQLGLIIICMFVARTWAMLVNRIADREIDKANPRTKHRALASGALSFKQGATLAALCAIAFIGACSLFQIFYANPWPLILCVPTLLWIGFYSFTKRFTFLCHAFLGGALAFSPIAAAIAIYPPALSGVPALWLIAGMVLFWVAGFDIAYALQDLDYDLRVGLWSVPTQFGWEGALRISRGCHALAFGLLIGAWRADSHFGPMFGVAILLVGALLIYEHVVLTRRGLAGLPMAFFTINGVVSCILGAVGCIDVLVR